MEKREAELLPAQILAAIMNFSMARPEKPADPRDYMLHYQAAHPGYKRQGQPRKKRMTAARRKQVCDFFRSIAVKG